MADRRVTTITYFSTLLQYAREEAEARESGDEERIKIASEKHEAYKQACLASDKMVIGLQKDLI